jgi:hypothetical protein
MLRPALFRPLAFASLAVCACAGIANGSIPVAVLHWTATGDDGSIGRATRYDIRRSTLPITPATFLLADTVGGAPLPADAGTAQSCDVLVPTPGRTYYFALRAADERGNWSSMSNLASYAVPVLALGDPGLLARAFDPPWPNPARVRATLRVTSPAEAGAEVSVYDVSGRLVRMLWSGPLESGTHAFEWDLRDEGAARVRAGVYFVRVRCGWWARVRSLAVAT